MSKWADKEYMVPVPEGSDMDGSGEGSMLLNRVKNAAFWLKLVGQHATLTPAEKLWSLHFSSHQAELTLMKGDGIKGSKQ